MRINRNKKVTVIGGGVVGTAYGKILSRAGFLLSFAEINPVRVRQLLDEGFSATNNLSQALEDSHYSLICVPTPTREKDGHFDGSAVLEVISKILLFIKKSPPKKRYNNFHTIIVKSTILPEFMEKIPSKTKLKLGKDYGLVFNPEFLRTESAAEDVLYKQIIIGSKDAKSAKAAKLLYRQIEKNLGVKFDYIFTDFISASLFKYKHNLWLATAMGHLMEFAKVCKSYGVDPHHIIHGTSNHDPSSWVRDDFLTNGFLDECLPKDSVAFLKNIGKKGLALTILENSLKINKQAIRKTNPNYNLQRFKLLKLISS